MYLYVWSCFFLSITCLICAIGLVSRTYRDNLFQTVGMFMLMVAAPSRIIDIWTREFVPPDWFFVHAGIGIFAVGVYFKVFMRLRHERFMEFQRKLGRSALERFVPTDTDWERYIRGETNVPPPDRRRAPVPHH